MTGQNECLNGIIPFLLIQGRGQIQFQPPADRRGVQDQRLRPRCDDRWQGATGLGEQGAAREARAKRGSWFGSLQRVTTVSFPIAITISSLMKTK